MDIEGTTSSVSFVYDVMFPFARRELGAFLRANWGTDEVAAACDQLARDSGAASWAEWTTTAMDADAQQDRVQSEVHRLMDTDAKTTGLKQLQGLVWRAGFESGEMRAHLYDDVPPALTRWKAAGIDVRIYSSGSVAAQKLFFAHTIHGDLLAQFAGHYDTKTGPKRESESYRKIAEETRIAPEQILFVSDVVEELDAAAHAGMQTVLSVRPGNAEVASKHRHPVVESFDQIETN